MRQWNHPRFTCCSRVAHDHHLLLDRFERCASVDATHYIAKNKGRERAKAPRVSAQKNRRSRHARRLFVHATQLDICQSASGSLRRFCHRPRRSITAGRHHGRGCLGTAAWPFGSAAALFGIVLLHSRVLSGFEASRNLLVDFARCAQLSTLRKTTKSSSYVNCK